MERERSAVLRFEMAGNAQKKCFTIKRLSLIVLFFILAVLLHIFTNVDEIRLKTGHTAMRKRSDLDRQRLIIQAEIYLAVSTLIIIVITIIVVICPFKAYDED